jgi:hypothetical protein
MDPLVHIDIASLAVDELDEDSDMAGQPPGVLVTLKAHQRTLLWKCMMLEAGPIGFSRIKSMRNFLAQTGQRGPTQSGQDDARDTMHTRLGIMADRVGSGKSYVVLALVHATRRDALRDEPVVRTFANNRVVLTMRDSLRPISATMLVIPHLLCSQWEGYIRRFGGGMDHVMVSRTKHMAAFETTEALERADLIVVTSSYYNQVVMLLNMHKLSLRRVVYDEADTLSIASCLPVPAAFTWFVTASYQNLVYPRGCFADQGQGQRFESVALGVKGTGYIKTLFSDLCRDVTRALIVKNRDDFVTRSMEFPEPCVQHVVCRDPVAVRVLRGAVDQCIIECLNAGDIASALKHVQACNRGNEESIVAMLLSKLQRQLRSLDMRIGIERTVEFESEAEREAELAPLEARREAVQQKMAMVKDRIVETRVCCICLDEVDTKAVLACCSNAFCFGCVSRWLHKQQLCPICKSPAALSQLLLVEGHDGGPARPAGPDQVHDKNQIKDKVQHLRSIVTSPGAKVLVFSSFENTFTEVVAMLQRSGVKHKYLKGNHMSVKNIVDNYRNHDLDVLLVNTNNYGSGLNLENTTDVVMMHRFNSEVERQVIGRAVRCGRTTPLRVTYLLYQNEMS